MSPRSDEEELPLASNERFPRPPLRFRRFGGGYRKEDVEFALAELRLTLRQLDNDLEALRERARELEEELRTARAEVESQRGKDAELGQAMAIALRRAAEIEEDAQARARAIIADAEGAALRARADAARSIEESGSQFSELLRQKDQLILTVRGVVGEFDQAISRAEQIQVARVAPAPAPPPVPQAPPPVAQAPQAPLPPEAVLAPPAAYVPAPEAAPAPPVAYAPPAVYAPPPAEPIMPPLSPRVEPAPAPPEPAVRLPQPPAPVAQQPPHDAPTVVPPAPAPQVAGDEPIFETQVELDAGPFPDFASLSAFERALAHLPRVDDVYVRRLADDRALIELTLSEPAPLVSTMRESLPYELDVRSASRTKLVINVYAHSTANR